MIYHVLVKKIITTVVLTRVYIIEKIDTTWILEYFVEKIKIKYATQTLIKNNIRRNKYRMSIYKTICFIKKVRFINMNVMVAFLTFVINTYIFHTFFYFNLLKYSYKQVVIIFIFYFFITTYFHFSKTYFINKYTTQTQRFWKRTFGAFWVLEFTLFFIYMFLLLISPSELPMHAINYKEIITSVNIIKNSNYHIIFLLVLMLINIIYIKKKNNFHIISILVFIVNFMYLYIIYFEFLKFYYVAGWGAHQTYSTVKMSINNFEYINLNTDIVNSNKNIYFKTPASVINSWTEQISEKQWLRTFRHFIYILLILKFWHVFLIYLYFVFSTVKFIETNYWSFDTISSNYQNAIYLIWFYIFSYVLVLKKKIYFLIIIVYKTMHVHINYTNILNMLVNEFNFNYLLNVKIKIYIQYFKIKNSKTSGFIKIFF